MTYVSTREWWYVIAPWVRAEPYGHRTDGQARIELKPNAPRSLLRLTAVCAHCRRDMLPVRERHGYSGGMYVAVTCASPSCSRSEDGRDEYAAARKFFTDNEIPPEQGRFL